MNNGGLKLKSTENKHQEAIHNKPTFKASCIIFVLEQSLFKKNALKFVQEQIQKLSRPTVKETGKEQCVR